MSRLLLRHALEERGLRPMELLHDDRGRPYLPDGPCVSVSHTAGAAAVALSGRPVGVDVERLRTVRQGLDRRIMGRREYEWYCARGRRTEDLLTLWTLKESYYKCLGTGLPGFPNGTEFYLEHGLWRLEGSPLRFWTEKKGDLLISLCHGDNEKAEIVMWPAES